MCNECKKLANHFLIKGHGKYLILGESSLTFYEIKIVYMCALEIVIRIMKMLVFFILILIL